MQYRTLGPEGLKVSAIGLGGRRLSDEYTETRGNDGKARALIDHAIGRGLTHIDTSDSYDDTRNESLLGRLLAGHKRTQTVIATKFGFTRDQNGTRRICGRPDYVAKACAASLKRLQTDVIDLYYLHRIDPEVPIEETVGAMARLKAEGKIRHIGLSEAGPETLRRACRVAPIAALQSDYSLWTRDYEADTLPACKELGIGFVAYYPLGSGFLAGAIRQLDALAEGDSRRRQPRLQPQNFDRNAALLEQLSGVARQKGCKLGQLALAWILARGPDYVAIPGTSQISHLDDNIAAADIALSVDDMARIDAIFPRHGAAAGDRVAPPRLKELNR